MRGCSGSKQRKTWKKEDKRHSLVGEAGELLAGEQQTTSTHEPSTQVVTIELEWGDEPDSETSDLADLVLRRDMTDDEQDATAPVPITTSQVRYRTSEIESLHVELEMQCLELKKLRQSNKELLVKVDKLEQASREDSKHSKDLKAQLDEAHRKVANLTQHIEDLQGNEQEGCVKKMQYLTSEIESRQVELEMRCLELKKLRQSNNELLVKVDKLEQISRKYSESKEDLKAQLEQAHMKVAELMQHIEDLQNNKQEVCVKNVRYLTSENESLQVELEMQCLELKKLRKSNKKILVKVDKLEQAIRKDSEPKEDLKAPLDQAHRKVAELMQHIEDLQGNKQEECVKKIRYLTSEIESRQVELEMRCLELKKLRQSNNELLVKVDKLEQAIRKDSEPNKDLKAQLDQAHMKVAELTQHIEDLQANMQEECVKKVRYLTSEIESLQVELEMRCLELKKLRQSNNELLVKVDNLEQASIKDSEHIENLKNFTHSYPQINCLTAL